MKVKSLAEFGLSFGLSLFSLLVISVPTATAHAVHASGSTRLTSVVDNPYATMGLTVIATGLLLLIALHYHRLNAKR